MDLLSYMYIYICIYVDLFAPSPTFSTASPIGHIMRLGPLRDFLQRAASETERVDGVDGGPLLA